MTRPAQQSEELATLRQLLRTRPPMDRKLPVFDPLDAPADPATLHVSWLLEAMTAELPDAQVVTFATSDGDGHPDARVLVLRDIDPATGRWSVFADLRSPMGEQLAVTPWAALTSYWPDFGRQVRVRGPVEAVDQQDAPPAERGSARPGTPPPWSAGRASGWAARGSWSPPGCWPPPRWPPTRPHRCRA
ncbi:pyridoxamine 5'-phosphate oxidase family protein [Kitasatospora gansuensis]